MTSTTRPICSSLPLIAGLALLSACAERPAVWQSHPEVMPTPSSLAPGSPEAQSLAQVLREAEQAWKDRANPAQLDLAITRWKEAARRAPSADLYVRLARAFHFRARSPAATDPASRLGALDQGTKAAEVALGLNSPELVTRVRHGQRWKEAMVGVGPQGVAALYWYGANLGAWAEQKGWREQQVHAPRVRAAMARCVELDSGFHQAAPLSHLAAMHAAGPILGGQDLELSEMLFKQALLRAPGSLSARVLMASTWCVQTGNKARFKRLLEEVLAADPALAPDLVPEQLLDKRQAEDLLRQLNRLF